MTVSKNKLSVIKNGFQTKANRVLCVCSGGVLRSPTFAVLLTQEPYKFNTRSCGTESYALIPLTEELVYWADEIVCAEENHYDDVLNLLDKAYGKDESRPCVHVVGIPDDYDYMDPELVTMANNRFKELF